ncbi:hypothetical protein, partial [Arsukibacterium sp.]|uniref:hypothetical protein n=1 Tax=Arsukibacterium sp. TaxID=1977258 RepID=UPI003564AED8
MKRLLLVGFGFFPAFQALAFNFSLSESEFNTWDQRCKIAFYASVSGKNSGFYHNLPPIQKDDVRRFGQEAGGAWHYCAGVIYLQRAAASTGDERIHNLDKAEGEIRFTINR